MDIISIDQFYSQIAPGDEGLMERLFPKNFTNDIGHFNVFDVRELWGPYHEKPQMPYNRRAYYKISLIIGRNKAEYADKIIDIEQNALLFATPKIPYHYVAKDNQQAGFFCVFTDEFLVKNKSGVVIDDLPIFRADGYPVFLLSQEETDEISLIFKKMMKEMASDYVYKYDLLRNFVLELIHVGQKLQPASALYNPHNSSARISSLFLELLERQFPIDSLQQKLALRSATDFANQLSIHVNYLNKVLKKQTGMNTTSIINNRVIIEAKILLKQTNWNISEIAYCLGFEEVAHFSNFFRKHTDVSPLLFRS